MTGKTLVLIEAPGKLKKLRQILGSDYALAASGGHIRTLADDGTDSLGFDLVGERISCRWIPRDARAKSTIAELKQAVKEASRVILATDEDREGESIAWHLADALGVKNPLRATYREITPAAVRSALANPRPLDRSLVNAGICRAVLDKLVGYKGSPLVWQLNNGAKSIGRVQSAALHILCDREAQIRSFVPQDYWSVFVDYEGFRAFYEGRRQESIGVRSQESGVRREEESEVDDAAERTSSQNESTKVLTQAEADRLVAIARQFPHQVIKVEGKTVYRTPPPPFITSSLQQAAGAKLKLSPEKVMQIAQSLYEQGHITYHRTDSVFMAESFVDSAQDWLHRHDPDNLPAKATSHRSNKNAQEAHEAIRPTDINRSSASLRPELSPEAFDLYVLIWIRAIASLCKPARLQQTKITTQSGDVNWQAKGQLLEFAGYTRYWNNLSDDVQLPLVQEGQTLELLNAGSEKKQTQPPPRYTEPKLVQQMERSGIGRPSTYAPTVATLKQRNYVELNKKVLQPTILGMEVDSFVAQALPKLVDTEFTAEMEFQLDRIAEGKINWEQWLTGWNREYLVPALQQAQQIVPTVAHQTILEVSKIACPKCQTLMVQVPSRKVKKGYFLKCQSCADTVMFWGERQKKWEVPQPKTEPQPVKLTEHSCPVCKKPLEEYNYQKEGQQKVMLRCSDAAARQQKKHKEAVYFQTPRGFWSPKFGEISE
ncbi:type I DNA topoisomerase [Merismopedia glauca]|uniref:DNA topoisomerase 1 n=1 Tax=Merismopedia glauca CCAP 1448/3 TaxID=1296344 RepID=A0A2T1C2E3_9CYAN|nr:type I DNA topoisomerase [Merismopedia glauca]PSB02374.1 type I DNA topoisomerase [Merismopedia glauca CCAP 1448/3]